MSLFASFPVEHLLLFLPVNLSLQQCSPVVLSRTTVSLCCKYVAVFLNITHLFIVPPIL